MFINFLITNLNNIKIITRNNGDFKNSNLPVLNAEEFLRIET